MKTKKIIIVDDHKIFRDGLRSIISGEGIAEIIGEASNGKELLDLLNHQLPDMILMDIEMPVMDGIEATRLAVEKHPDIKILALSMFGDEKFYYKMIEAGVKGFALKTSGIDKLKKAMLDVISGDCYFDEELLRRVIKNLGKEKKNHQEEGELSGKLTQREIEVLSLISEGFTNEEIAEKIHISPATVKGHRSNILSKTGCKNTASLVVYAIRNKIIII
jgi:DNA-binding NarL/FixJ family response regulator